jgi:AraC-like DNA-binding protein
MTTEDAARMAAGGTASGFVLELRGSGVARPGRVDVLLATPDLVLGEFSCGPDDELWSVDNDIGDLPHIVWPATTVEILRSGSATLCADANTVVLYDPGTAYRRRRIASAGDRSVFLALRSGLLDQLPAALVHPDGERFAAGHVFCSARSWLGKERLVAASRARRIDPLRLEEMALAVVAEAADETDPPNAMSTGNVRARVEQASVLLGRQLEAPQLVTDVARVVGISPFHLARQFRACKGQSMYAYRQGLRLRSAVRRVFEEPGADLAAVAADSGFASHSHFSASCRRAFGEPPSALRAALRA